MNAAPKLPDPGDAERYTELASVHPDTASTAARFERLKAVAWLVENGLASHWPKVTPGADKAPGEPVVQGNPTLKWIAAQREASRPRAKAVLVCIDDIESREPEWLWPGRIPLGRVSMIMGRMGDGKSTLIGWLAATVSTGNRWPDTDETNEPGSVIILQAEEVAEEDIRPRLDGFGFGKGKIHVLRGVDHGDGVTATFSISRDVEALREALDRLRDVRLILIDPLGSYIRGITGYNDSEVREFLQPLFDLALEYGVAVVLVAHPNKDKDKDILDRVSGAGAFVQMCRMSWYLSEDPSDKSRRLLSLMKGNIRGATRTAIALHYSDRTQAMTWLTEPVNLNARQVDNLLQKEQRVAKIRATSDADTASWKKACELLLELVQRGPLLQSAAQDQLLNLGVFGESTFRKAMKHMVTVDGRVRREKRKPEMRWWLMLAEAPPPPASGDGADTESD